MQFELIPNENVGIITDATPIFRDIKDTYNVSFILPDDGVYVALFRDERGVEYRAMIKDGAVSIPKHILGKEQRAGLTVCKTTDEEIEHSWECPTLKIGTFLSLRQTQWQITVGTDDKELYKRFADIERENARRGSECAALLDNFNVLQAEFMRCQQEIERVVKECSERQTEQIMALASVKTTNEMLAATYNQAIEVINDLAQRVAALEANYDPTIIK